MDARWVRRAEALQLIGQAAQPFVLLGALVTFGLSEWHKSTERSIELSRPYYEKQLDLYLESARVAARLAALKKDDPSYPETVNRFWELYWGELAFVESESVERLMVEICRTYVSPENKSRCTSSPDSHQGQALALAHHESQEIRRRWTGGFWP